MIRPPVPDLIPIAALRSPPGGRREEVMGEQRPRRPAAQPAAQPAAIDTARSRGCGAAPEPPPARKARARRKSDRRRDRRKTQAKHSPPSSPERSPQVNPIFVWVRQEDTRIVDVKCEDYDKRNRILLTKTAQGWRAIPRTETSAPTLRAEHHHHHRRRSRRGKVRRRSTAVQVDDDLPQDQEDDVCDEDDQQEGGACPSPTWTSPVNVESHLPSHKIHVPMKCLGPQVNSVNSAVNDCRAQTPDKCSAKICDVSPLDNLLAVAEFEFNQHMQSGKWDKTDDDENFSNDQNPFMDNVDEFIESCSKNDNTTTSQFGDIDDLKADDCDYTEDDDNNLAMDDILSRLEQSLRSPECTDPDSLRLCEDNKISKELNQDIGDIEDLIPAADNDADCEENNNYDSIPISEDQIENNQGEDKDEQEEEDEEVESYFEHHEDPVGTDVKHSVEEENLSSEMPQSQDEVDPKTPQQVVESSTTNEDVPTDLSVKAHCDNMERQVAELPTDLTIPRNVLSPLPEIRPPSQNSEAIQSPQPSGIPAVPPSPDIVTTSCANKSKSVFLESLLTMTSPNVSLNSEVTITRQREPLDLGKCRKSASPTITCSSEEVKDCTEPPSKKIKPGNITLKSLLVEDITNSDVEKNITEKNNAAAETPRLLELLKNESGPDPLTQLRQILYDTSLNVPDPMLVPKERLSQIISHPAREIPKLLKQRPELRLPEALAFPHLLQDPDILVITLQQLETIIMKQNQSLSISKDHQKEKVSKPCEVVKESPSSSLKAKIDDSVRKTCQGPPAINSNFKEMASDFEAATTAAFNQMLWLPYLNQLESMSFGTNPEMLKMLSGSGPMYPGPMPELGHMPSRFVPPVNFPIRHPHHQTNYGTLELSMWQEAMMQANLLRPKNPFDGLNQKNSYREYLDKFNFASMASKPSGQQKIIPNVVNKAPSMPMPFFTPQTTENNGHHSLYANSSHLSAQKNKHSSHRTGQMPSSSHYSSFASKGSGSHPHHQHQRSSHAYVPPNKYRHQKPDCGFSNFYFPKVEEKHNAKMPSKQFPNVKEQSREKSNLPTKVYSQPIDLSGSTTPTAKLKVKQHLIDPVSTPNLLKHDDIPEVGSTTASVEEMQDAHKHLWHPLFGK